MQSKGDVLEKKKIGKQKQKQPRDAGRSIKFADQRRSCEALPTYPGLQSLKLKANTRWCCALAHLLKMDW
jgi:hypothetical protein